MGSLYRNNSIGYPDVRKRVLLTGNSSDGYPYMRKVGSIVLEELCQVPSCENGFSSAQGGERINMAFLKMKRISCRRSRG